MAFLALETSCDETSAAIVKSGRVLSNCVSSQIELHAEYGGVVPELAARAHLTNLRPVIDEALAQAGTSISDLAGIAATAGPGLPNALIVGLRAAQAIAFSLGIPFYAINHHEAHLYSPWIGREEGFPAGLRPNISLIVSGGHTLLVRVDGLGRHMVLGSTLDDAAGECFDKVGKLLGLPYPAGPVVDRLASQGDPKAFSFPRPLLSDLGHDFSFSGLKTAVRYCVRDQADRLHEIQFVKDICASAQAAIVEVLVAKTIRAARQANVRYVTASGGVTCNSQLRNDLARAAQAEGMELILATPAYCTDNAAMIGILAEAFASVGKPPTDLDADVNPNWDLSHAFN